MIGFFQFRKNYCITKKNFLLIIFTFLTLSTSYIGEGTTKNILSLRGKKYDEHKQKKEIDITLRISKKTCLTLSKQGKKTADVSEMIRRAIHHYMNCDKYKKEMRTNE